MKTESIIFADYAPSLPRVTDVDSGEITLAIMHAWIDLLRYAPENDTVAALRELLQKLKNDYVGKSSRLSKIEAQIDRVLSEWNSLECEINELGQMVD